MTRRLVLWGIAAQIIALSGCGSESLQQLATTENLDAQASGDQAISQASLGAGVVPVMEGADGSAPGPADDFQAGLDGEVQVASLDGSREAASESGGVAQDDALIVATDEGDEAVADEQAPILEFEIAGFATDLVPPEPTSVVIKFRPGSSASERSALHRANGLLVDRTIPQLQIHTVKIPPGKTADEVIARYERHPLVEFVEVEQHFAPAFIPNDPYYDMGWISAWHLPKIGAPAAWDITRGSPNVIIAILDSGVYGAHEDLAPNMVAGWNVLHDNDDTHDTGGHGTAVAGQAAAAGNNGIHVASVAWHSKIMPIVVTDDGWTGSVALATGVVWAADHGARIANMSFEGSHTSIMTSAAQYMQDRGGVVI